jgi:hypothetical protein
LATQDGGSQPIDEVLERDGLKSEFNPAYVRAKSGFRVGLVISAIIFGFHYLVVFRDIRFPEQIGYESPGVDALLLALGAAGLAIGPLLRPTVWTYSVGFIINMMALCLNMSSRI